jgi:hypothetical protein
MQTEKVKCEDCDGCCCDHAGCCEERGKCPEHDRIESDEDEQDKEWWDRMTLGCRKYHEKKEEN